VPASQVVEIRVPSRGDEADLVLFFGQSNCEGWAHPEGLPAGLRGAQPVVRIWNVVERRWQAVEAGRNTNYSPGAPFFGAELGLAAAAAGQTTPVWIIKAAQSPSSLGPTPGPWNEWGAHAGELYPLLIARVEMAADAIRKQGLVPRVRAIWMMQGESDALEKGLARGYAGHLEELLLTLRVDLELRDLVGRVPPRLRIGLIDARLGALGLPWTGRVRDAQRAVAANLSDCAVVETSDLSVLADGIHFDAAGLVELGRRLFGDGP
ncbi:MAG: hypothetical protein KDC98_21345, partial [Planctomycetes bacterium]|nr:hypothetical protein [Planctomycetota bacterium]